MTKKCRVCKEEIHSNAKKCKHCWADQSNWFRRHWILTGIGIIILLSVFWSLVWDNTSKNTHSNSSTEWNQQQATYINKPTISKDEFLQLQDWMSYEQVVEIVWGEGEVMSENNLAGVNTVMYMRDWDTFASNANVMFQDNKLIQKAQFGLK